MNTNEKAAPAGSRDGLNFDPLASKIGAENTAEPAHTQGGEAIFCDGQHISFIVDRRDGCDAIAACGRRLGKFNTQSAAARALLYAANLRDEHHA